jgi:hypothetical protein
MNKNVVRGAIKMGVSSEVSLRFAATTGDHDLLLNCADSNIARTQRVMLLVCRGYGNQKVSGEQ